jgi:hypothetical protein
MRSIGSKPNTSPANSDYPFGRIKDDPGNGTGTPVNEQVYGDFHYAIEKLVRDAGIIPNDLPENEYSGYQIVEALEKWFVADPAKLGIKKKIMNIGAWNMNLGNRQFQHLLDWRKIISINVLIYNDANTNAQPLILANQSTGQTAGSWELNSINIILKATLGELYESSGSYDDTSLNRGIVVFEYTD